MRICKEESSINLTKIIFICISVITFGTSTYLAIRNNIYQDVESLYQGYLIGALLRHIALFSAVVAIWLHSIPWIKSKIVIEEKKYLSIIFVAIFSIALMYSTIATVLDLVHQKPLEIQGTIVKKDEIYLIKGSVEYHIKLFNSKEDLLMVGDNYRNGFNTVKTGDYVKIYYGKNTKYAFLVTKK